MNKNLLRREYYNPSGIGGYGGVQRHVEQTSKAARKWLRSQRVYTLHKPARKRFDTRPYKTPGIDYLWQADLAEFGNYSTINNGYNYMLTVIDVFSRYAWARPVRHKTGKLVMEAFRDILQTDNRKPRLLQTDQGKEFENAMFQGFLREQGIRFFTIKSQFKAALAERFNRTIKSKLWRYFTHTGTYKWIDVLPKFMQAYNSSKHRVIGMAPKNVNVNNEMELWMAQEARHPQRVTWRNPRYMFRVGDHVRISKVKQHFDKGYLPNWTEEIFTISHVLTKYDPPQFKLVDWSGEDIQGSFYAAELQLVDKPDEYMIERVLAERRAPNGEREYLVKWLGYGPQFNSWVANINTINGRLQVTESPTL